MAMRILVLHGPNLQLLGTREPEIYGKASLSEIDRQLKQLADELGASVVCRQSNHEGELVTWAGHAGQEGFAGLLLNGAALTHTSVALHDAIRASSLPCVEVHLSNIHGREAFRQHSHTASACLGVVTGFGSLSYSLGLRALIDYLHGAEQDAAGK